MSDPHTSTFVELAPGLGVIARDPLLEAARQGDIVSVGVLWQARETPRDDLAVELVLVSADGQDALTQAFPLGLGYPTSASGRPTKWCRRAMLSRCVTHQRAVFG